MDRYYLVDVFGDLNDKYYDIWAGKTSYSPARLLRHQ